MMKRILALIMAALIGSPFLYVPPVGAVCTETRYLGGEGDLNAGDVAFGTGYYDTATCGRRVYRINMDSIPFPQDNTIRGGNANAYGSAYGVVGAWTMPYYGASGAFGTVALGALNTCWKSTGTSSAPTWGDCGTGSGSASFSGDNGALMYSKDNVVTQLPGAGYSADDNTIDVPATKAPSFTAARTAGGGYQLLWEGLANGDEWVRLKASDSLSDNLTWTLPSADGTTGQALVTDGSGTLSFAGVAASSLPTGTNPTVDAPGEAALDNSAGAGAGFRGYANTTLGALTIPYYQTKCTTIDNAVAASDYMVESWPYAVTVREARYTQIGATNWVGQVQNCNANGASCANMAAEDSTVTSSTVSVTSFSDAALAANEILYVNTSSVSGTNTHLMVCVSVTVDPVN